MNTTPKKILIFSLSYYPFAGGAEAAVKEITDRIPKENIEFHMVTNRYDATLPKKEWVGNVLVHRIGLVSKKPTMADLRTFPLHVNKLLYQFLAYYKARKLHSAHAYNGVWALMAHTSGVPAGLFKGAFPDVRYILNLQEGDPLNQIERKLRFFGPLFKRAFVRADILQSISTYLEAWGKRMGFSGISYVIPNAVDVAHFSKTFPEEENRAIRKSLGLSDSDIALVTASRLVHKNANDDVIRALMHLEKRVHFVLIGEGSDEAQLKTLAKETGVAERVHFVPWQTVLREKLPAYLSASDIFIRPSRSEGFGISFVEAMAAGLPVIATQVGGIADFLFDAERNSEKPATGFAVDPDSPEQIREQVEYILGHKEEVSATVAEAKKMVEELYDWDIIAGDMEEKVFSHV